MKKINAKQILLLAACLSAIGSASVSGAQTVRHDRMDARAARADIRRLKLDRRRAMRRHDFGKVAQDDRLIADDKKFVRKDVHKVIRATG